jgi:enoyl-CoA hydratase/carnithine racemase
MSNPKHAKKLTNFIPTPKFEDYQEIFKEHFVMEKRDDGVLSVRMHTLGGQVQWNAELHRAIWQMWKTIGGDPTIEVVIFSATGENFLAEFDNASWAQIEDPEYGGDLASATYEHMMFDGRQMLIQMVISCEIPTIGILHGVSYHSELALLCDLVICTDDTVIQDPHYSFGLVPGDGIHSCLIEHLGIRRATYAMLMNQPIPAKLALEYGLVSEVHPRDKVMARAYEMADQLMMQSRHVRRLSTLVLRRTMKQRLVDDLDGAFGIEMYCDLATGHKHDDAKLDEIAAREKHFNQDHMFLDNISEKK